MSIRGRGSGRVGASVVSAVLALSVAAPSSSAAARAFGASCASCANRAVAALEPGAAQVTVDAHEVGTMPSRMVVDVTVKATQAIEDAGLSPQAVRLTFVEIDPVEVLRGVRVTIVGGEAPVLDPGGDPRGPLLASCTACSDAELAGLAIEAVLEAIEVHRDALQAQREAAEAAAAAAASADATEPAPEPAPPSDEPHRRLGPLGWAGIGTLGVGAGTLVAGAVLASRSPAPFPDEPRMDVLRDLRPPGYALLGVGGALLVTGVVLLVVDRRRARASRLAGHRAWHPRARSIGRLVP